MIILIVKFHYSFNYLSRFYYFFFIWRYTENGITFPVADCSMVVWA